MAAEEDSVKVCVRVRPLIQREQGDQSNLIWRAENSTISQIDGTRSFNFDRVFNSHETTSQVYQEVAVPIIRSALQGYNGTIFAYGQTSSGKTYTMMGSPDNLGIIPQAVKEIFRIIQEIPNREFLLRVSYMEIYNETVTDLLCDGRKRKPLEVREDFNRNVYVADLTEELVVVPEAVMEWIKKGEKNRHYGQTKMNEHSSRSHTIFRMIVESRERNGPANSENCDGAVMVSHLNLVDLAGSERASQTGAEGLRLKEGCNINRSLFILGQVIKKLSDDTTGVFINYRDSKLTRILQNSLGGNTKTVIICTITTVCFDETLSTLQFASTAKKVKNKPHVNEVLDDEALLKRYRKEILDLKKQLENLEASSESKTQAMAIEEHAQLLEEIQQLRKEREDRIWNLTNIVVASSQASQDDQRVKRKRRVTWAPGKLLNSLYGADRSGFDTGSKMNFNFPKKAKLTEFASLTEIDQSICTEFSDFDDTSRVFDDFAIDLDCNIGNTVTRREKMESDQPIMDFTSETSFQDGALVKDSLATKNKDMDQKLAELENQLQVLTKDYNAEVEKRESFLNEVSSLKQQLKAKEDEKDEVVRTCQMEISSLKNELQSILKDNEVTDGLRTPVEKDCLEVKHQALSPITMSSSHQSCQTEQIQEDFAEEKLPSHIHDVCQEQIKMLEQKIADLEGNSQQSEFVESIQICEALMAERETALNELATLRYSYENLKEEIENLTQDKTSLEKALQDKSETNEFEVLEKETQKEYEAQLIHEITSLKKLVENAELFNQDLEVELENKSKLLEEQDKQIAALKKDVEALQKKARFSDLSECLGGDGEKLCEEVFQLKQSLADAETVTRDAQREAAFLRSANLEMKDKMDELSLRCEQREKDAFTCEKQLEVEKSNYKRMQADLQKELQYAFNEINHLSGLLEGRVPKDLLSRVELEKQLASALQEKSGLEGEVASMSEYKSLPNEIEMLKCQVQKSAEEHHMLQSENKHSVSVISEQSTKIQEQAECIERLMKELTDVQTMCQQAEQQYSDLKILHEELQKRCSSTDQEIEKKNSDSECLVKEIHELKRSLDDLEGKLSSQVETLQQQAERQSELLEEKLDLEQKHFKLMTEMEKLKEELNTLQASQSAFHTKNAEDSLQEVQNEMKLLIQQREELQSKVEELVAERNILKQDLNENIEMSIETQDELRQTQEDLKQQKQLVANLSKMISDNGKDPAVKAESLENIAEMSMPLDSRTQLQAIEVKDEALSNEKMVLETSDQESVISELENIQERLKSAELALASMLAEKNNLVQKLHGLQEELQAVTGQRDELEDIRKSLQQQQDDFRDEKERTEKQVHQLSEQLQLLADRPLQGDLTGLLQEQNQERENLLETLKAVTEERDQLKLDLQDNIETSIETQDELRNSLEELTKKSQLLDLLKSQQNDLDGLKKDLENKVSHLEEQLQESMTERDQLLNELKQLKDQMIDLGESYSASTHVVMDKETKDHEVQVITEMFADGQMDVTSQLEEAEAVNRLLTERSEHLQQQMHIISQERDLHKQLIDTLTAEKMQLNTDIQRCTENEVIKDRHIEDLVTVIETLKEHLENAKQKLELKEREAMDAADMGNTDNMAELQLLEENLQQRNIQIENMEKEKLELSDKFCALQEELEKVTEYRDDLQCKLESALSENTNIKENMEKIMTSSSTAQEELQRCREELAQQTDLVNSLRLQIPDSVSLQRKETQTEDTPSMGEKALSLQEELLQKSSECEMLLQTQNKLEEAKDALNHEVESLMERLIDTQSNLESVQSEKQQAEEQLLHLQQQLNLSIQEMEELKVTQQRFIAKMDQQPLNGNQEMEQLQGVACQHGDFEESQRTLQNEIEQLRISLKSTESELETLRREKFENDKNLHQLQHNKEIDVLKALNDQQERLEETVPSKPLNSDLDHLLETLKNLESQLATVQNEKVNIEENFCTLKSKMDSIALEKYELQTELQSLQSERNQLKEDLRENIEISIETQEEIRKTQEELQQYKERASQLTKDISGLEQKSSSLERELLETATILRGANSEKENLEQSKEKMALEIEQLKHELERKGFALEEAEKEILQSSHKIAELTELKNTPEESDPKNFSEQNVEKEYLETLENLRRTREELQLQEEKVDHFTTKISLLEDKISLLQSELQDKIIILKEATDKKEILSQAQEKMSSEIEQLIELLKNKDAELELREQEKEEAAQKTIALTEELRNALQERIQLQLLAESRQEEISLLQSELHDQIILLKEATDEKEILSQVQEKMSSEIEQLMELLKNRDTELEQKEQEKEVAAHKTIALTEELRNASQERIQLQLLAESRQEEANKLKEDLKQLQLQHNEFCDQEKVKSGKIEELKTELTLLKEMIDVKASSVLQLEAEKAALQKQVQQYELEIASLRQEQEQCQHLLQRARDEKENIYTDLKDQEKSNEQLRESLSSCQSELEMARKQRDESKDHLTEKVNEVNKIMQQLSSLQQELQQLQQELKDEKMKNHDLSETVDHQEKEIRALRLMQSEPVQDEDDIEKCTEFLHQKNGEMKDLMVNISSSYANEYSLLNSLCSELQTEIEEQNQTMIAIKETLSPTISREFGNMQTEYIKINTQLQTVLNKLKAVYRNAAIKEEQFSIVEDYERDLCSVQKQNDELLLQCQNLEQSGTKWSENATEELKFCELQFLNKLLFNKMEVIKRVEDGFSAVQGILTSMGGYLKEEVTEKKQFRLWLENLKGLHFDLNKFTEGILQENKRITGVGRLLTNNLKTFAQSRIKQDILAYLKQFEVDLQEKKAKNKELQEKMQRLAPFGDSQILEEENARLCDKLRNLNAELKRMQRRIQELEDEVAIAKADAKQKEQKALMLQEKLLSSVAETELLELRANISEKEKTLQAAQREIKFLYEKVAKGAEPFKDEIDHLKSQVVKVEMERMKLSKSTDSQITSLKACVEYKEECVRKLKELLRQSKKDDDDATICPDKNYHSSYPATCGGGSGIVQSTAMLMLQSENAALKREISHYKKKYQQRTRNTSNREEELKKSQGRSLETPSPLLGSLHQPDASSQNSAVSPNKSEHPPHYLFSPGKTGMLRKRGMSPSKTKLYKPEVKSPKKAVRHSIPVSSPGKSDLSNKRALSPLRTEGQLPSTLPLSPCKKSRLPENASPVKDKFFDERSKSLPYYPTKFFDNSTLGTLPDEVNTGSTTETNDINKWWDQPDNNKNVNDCKTS